MNAFLYLHYLQSDCELQPTDHQCINLTNVKSTGKARAGRLWRSEGKNDVDKLESPEKSRRMARYLGHMSYQERQNQWYLLSLKKD